MTTAPRSPAPLSARGALSARLDRVLRGDGSDLEVLRGARPLDERDALQSLLTIHELHIGAIDRVGPAVRWQHHPVVAELKGRLEDLLLADVDATAPAPRSGDAVTAMRALARRDLVPPVYDWLAEEASMEELVRFLALEGGPDGGFDDLVAVCQVGLEGEPKLELARNYWDEMGRGILAEVHTVLHQQLGAAIGMPAVPREEQPLSGLRRTALGTTLATNRYLQPELVGALGLLELQAGPRCRRVVRALTRLGAPAGAFPFYVEHADVDPIHGKAWLDKVVAPLQDDEWWSAGIVRGARWRSAANAAFFAETEAMLVDTHPRQRLLSA